MSTSIGYTNSIPGSFSKLIFNPTTVGRNLGGGYQGYMPQAVNTTEKGSYGSNDFDTIRFTLREAWNTTYPTQLKVAKKKSIITPFRAVTNSGDLMSRENYVCGGTCQTFQSRPGMFGLRQRFGATSNVCSGTFYSTYQIAPSIPSATCNVKYVYDGSDYTRYLKEKAMNKNYNDLTFGGNASNGSQSAIRAIKRY
jgi:hypothetical protein